MALVAGIDEAGLGPVLGPMVVSASAFVLGDDQAQGSMWKLLGGCVCRKPSKRGLIAYADSKKLYAGLKGKDGLANLERGVLSMLGADGELPADLGALLSRVAPDCQASTSQCPWYSHEEPSLPHSCDAMDLKLAANSLARRMSAVGMKLADLHSQVLLESEFNRLIEITRNKSSLILDVTFRLLDRIYRLGHERTWIHVDRQGGRMHYLDALGRTFPQCRMRVLEENETTSCYELTEGPRVTVIGFQVGCEQRHLPVALASMLSKYVRELLMGVYNRFWIKHLPHVQPTAGYYNDGRRFYEEILPVVRQLGLADSQLWRCR